MLRMLSVEDLSIGHRKITRGGWVVVSRAPTATAPGIMVAEHILKPYALPSRLHGSECFDMGVEWHADLFTTEDDSPYPEVRSAVANTDDPEMPVNTIRAWCIGLAWSMILPGMNQFFFFRYPSITVTGVRRLPPDRFIVH